MLLHVVLCLASLTVITLALPNTAPREAAATAREARIAAFNAQRPMHTTALLAGAATATSGAKVKEKSKARDVRIRDLRAVTGESGMWVSLEDLRRTVPTEEEVKFEEEDETYRLKEKAATIRELWDMHAVEI